MATQDPGSTTIKPLTPDTWSLFAALVERHDGIFGGCWCVKFHPERADHVPGYDGNRVFKKCMVEEGIAHAALVVRDGEDGEEAIAWAEYGTPAQLPDIHHSKQYLEEQDLEPDYRITCIFVDKRFRQHGLVTVALEGALALIARAGGGVVEGYPHIPGERRVGDGAEVEVVVNSGLVLAAPLGSLGAVASHLVREGEDAGAHEVCGDAGATLGIPSSFDEGLAVEEPQCGRDRDGGELETPVLVGSEFQEFVLRGVLSVAALGGRG